MTFRSTIPVDTDGAFPQALSLNDDKAQTVVISGTTARNASAFDSETRVIEIYSDVDCFVRQGLVAVVATTSDHFFPAGFNKLFSIGGDKVVQKTYIAVIQSSSGGTLYISEVH